MSRVTDLGAMIEAQGTEGDIWPLRCEWVRLAGEAAGEKEEVRKDLHAAQQRIERQIMLLHTGFQVGDIIRHLHDEIDREIVRLELVNSPEHLNMPIAVRMIFPAGFATWEPRKWALRFRADRDKESLPPHA